jgi:hypothetical protein
MSNQSFTEFKEKRAALANEITRLCNAFSDEFGVKVESIYIDNHVYQHGMKSEQILSITINTDT